MEFCLITKTLLTGTEGARLCGIRVQGRHRRQAQTPRRLPDPGPPAESECLQWNSTLNFQTLKKTVDQLDGVCLQ
ncbi:hypothetical protein KEH51_20995 [[Brevibacterium] frigoritolerans]|uniref:Uncharacterized protein n=1 Tax=Peribacillus frigoritolerans TaxID=450367 RepID=A0A941FLC4_9BACI|nr:hypothetical protein [Peribacillus frigoritolerans]